MSRKTALVSLIFCLTAGLVVLPAIAVPTPDPANDIWQFDIVYSQPCPIVIKVPGEADAKLYWYMTYTVTNNTGQDRYFVPDFTLYTNTGSIVKAGAGINPAVFDKIKEVVGDSLLLPQDKMNGKLLQGEDNAKTGVAIFSDFDAQAGGFDIFVGGLSNNTQTVELPEPVTVEKVNDEGKVVKVKTDKIILNKTLKLEYLVGVQAADRASARVTFLGQEWVMR